MFEYFEKGTEPTEYITERFNDDIYSTSSGEAVEELF
jgi:penicillin-binding protein 1A